MLAAKARDRGFRPVHPEKGNAAGSASSGPRTRSAAAAAAGTAVPWEEAHRHAGEEVVVEGTIVRTHRTKTMLYLNFHSNWKRYLTIVVFAKDLPRFPGNPASDYKGKKVRVRGEVKIYKGRPEMALRDPADITVLP